MTTTTAPRWHSKRTPESDVVETALRAAGFDRVDAYRYNSAAIRLRVIDPRFEGLSRGQRDALVEPDWAKLPPRTRSAIMTLLSVAPSELSLQWPEFRDGLRNLEFEEPGRSML